MKWMTMLLAMLCATAALAVEAPATAAPERAKAYFVELAAKAAAAEQQEASVVHGKENWLFLTTELKSLGIGAEFWGENAAKVSHIPTPTAQDPLAVILDFKSQCDNAGVELLLVPVPGKAVIYPEKISAVKDAAPRLDYYHAAFYTVLRAKGVNVCDPTPLLLQHRVDKNGAMFCRTDSHWSGQACVLVAKMLADAITPRPWYTAVPKRKYDSEVRDVQISGDLIGMQKDPAIGAETLKLTVVKEHTAAGPAPVDSWRDSPVVLLGDSHNLIFHSGDDMLYTGAGLADQLARQLSFPVDIVAVRGSGATPARKNLARRQDNLAGKRLIIWCFTTREFTEGQGWAKVTVVREKAGK